ncbi:TPM domain-containing protein [Lacticaseibacillus absianus]|uniref:TPM domain-containing protein n=1 Tax=Lacticaseibacillus absianus TaxID=2729623 RepID=UPI0015CD9954|nr:TPM domain-containing protein [Lacticaseibacillus absianus]
MRKGAWWWLLLPLVLMGWSATPVSAASLPSAPTAHYYYDGLDLLTSQTRERIDAKNQYYQTTKPQPQIAVAVVDSTGGDAIGAYAPDLFQKWGVGAKGEDNGVMIVYADNDGAHNMRIEVGYGLEDVLTDALAGRILQQHLADIKAKDPARVDRAMRAVFNAVATVIDQRYKFPKDSGTVSDATMRQYQRDDTTDRSRNTGGGILRLIVGGFFVLIIAVLLMGGGGGRGGRGGRRGSGDWWLWWLLGSLMSSGRRRGPWGGGGFGGGNNSGFGGGGGFGGGSSWGGGSSGGGGADV